MTEIRLRSDRLQWLETNGEVVALDESTLSYLGVNDSGAVIWHALAAGTTRDALASLVVEAFDVDPATAAADVDAFLDELGRRQLLAG